MWTVPSVCHHPSSTDWWWLGPGRRQDATLPLYQETVEGSTSLPHLHPWKRGTPITAQARASTDLSSDLLMFTSRNDGQRTSCCARGFLWALSLQLTQPAATICPFSCLHGQERDRQGGGEGRGQEAVSEGGYWVQFHQQGRQLEPSSNGRSEKSVCQMLGRPRESLEVRLRVLGVWSRGCFMFLPAPAHIPAAAIPRPPPPPSTPVFVIELLHGT